MRGLLFAVVLGAAVLEAFAPTLAVAAHVIVTAQTDRAAYSPGVVVGFTLFVTNPSSSAVTLTFPTTQLYDFVVTSALDGREI